MFFARSAIVLWVYPERETLMSATPCMAVFTGETKDEIVNNRGSKAWKLNRQRATGIKKLVCTRNARNQATLGCEKHRAAFLLAEIENIVRSPEQPDRWIIKINKVAEPLEGILVKGGWPVGWQYPIAYTTLEELEIDETQWKWRELLPDNSEGPRDGHRKGVTFKEIIAEARRSLAKALDVPESSVIIEIRG
jgi:hypothetical protein